MLRQVVTAFIRPFDIILFAVEVLIEVGVDVTVGPLFVAVMCWILLAESARRRPVVGVMVVMLVFMLLAELANVLTVTKPGVTCVVVPRINCSPPPRTVVALAVLDTGINGVTP